MSSKKARATVTIVYGCRRAIKWAYLEKRSTTVRTADFPPARGKPSTKSMEISAQTELGMSNACNNPAGCRCSVLLCWQTVQPLMKSRTRRGAWGF
jgi:hypothetical protein